jgi:hypothetical protein
MNIILSEYVNKQEYDAGNKARSDALKVLINLGYKHIPLYRSGAKKIVILFQLICGCIRTICSANNGDNVFLQYPYYPYVVNKVIFAFLKFGKKIKKYKMILLLHDVMGLRNEYLNSVEGEKCLREEIDSLNFFNVIICHNSQMVEKFKSIGGTGNYKILGPFDYLYEKKAIKGEFEKNKVKIIIAGNLTKEKCSYIYNLPNYKSITLNLYGIGYTGESSNKINYKGKFPPDELIEHLEGNFGLVWDGNSIMTCSGSFGQYLKYNNPHKFSLYLAAGLPLIVWSQSALAQYVLENGIGICVENLNNLDHILGQLTLDEYMLMRKNVLCLRKDIVVGKHLSTLLDY